MHARALLAPLLSLAVGPGSTDSLRSAPPALIGPDAAPGLSAPFLADLERSEYGFSAADGGARVAPNRAQNLRGRVDLGGLSVEPRDPRLAPGARAWTLALRTRSWGRPGRLEPFAPTQLRGRDEGVELEGHSLTEWYVNDPRGLEQGWTVPFAPAGAPDAPLRIEVEVRGLRASVARAGDVAEFLDPTGAVCARWRDLRAWDAGERNLPARIVCVAEGLAIEVDIAGARFPVTVDPMLEGPGWTAESDQVSALFGSSVSGAGDVNGDGYADVLVGAPRFDAPEIDEGRAFLYLGSATGLSAAPAWTAEGDQASALFGSSVAGAGDVDGDGFDDVIVGAPGFSNGQTAEGRAFLYRGSASGLAAAPTWSAESDQANAHFGADVSGGGDWHGDGFDDVLVGSPDFDAPNADAGRAWGFRGSSTGLSASAVWSTNPNEPFAGYATSLASAGDVNHDGFDDVIVGAPRSPPGGRAYLYRGSATGLVAGNWQISTAQTTTTIGAVVAGAGDVNGDGFDDALVGDPTYDFLGHDVGRAMLFRGGPSGLALTANWSVWGNQALARFGASLAGAGDVDGDGRDDVIIGAPDFDSGEINEGRAFLFMGTPSGLHPGPAWTGEPDVTGAQHGSSVAGAGDVNGDGIDDVVVGARGFANGQSSEGRAFLYTGRVWRDCNANGLHDLDDIDSGASVDVDLDRVPDECETAGMPFCAGDGSAAPCPCGNSSPAGQRRGCLNSFGRGAWLVALGTPRVSADTLTLHGFDMPPVAQVIYLQGSAAEGGGAGTPYGDGLLCVGGTIVRLGARTSVGGASSFGYDAGDAPISVQGGVPPAGGTFRYQAWYRNSAPYCTAETFNTSNGVTVTWQP